MEKKLPLVHNERLWARPWRWAKTVFFLVSMLASLLLVCAPPLLVVLLDLLLPPALLSNFLRAAAAAHHPASLLDQARAPFHFGSSLVDLPAVSAARSLLILCAYTACGGGAAYLWVAVACSVGSLFYVLAKAATVFGGAGLELQEKGQVVAVEAMFLMSLALAAAHLAMAYRASCRERRRLLVYRIDVEAEPARGNGGGGGGGRGGLRIADGGLRMGKGGATSKLCRLCARLKASGERACTQGWSKNGRRRRSSGEGRADGGGGGEAKRRAYTQVTETMHRLTLA